MVAGHLREQNGLYQIILSYKDGDGKRKTKSISTGLPVKGNKRKAEAMLMDARQTFVPPVFAVAPLEKAKPDELLFTDFILEWLEMMKNSVETTTYASYCMVIKRKIVPYFKDKRILLKDLTPKDIQDYYQYSLNTEKVTANTVIHRHANIRKSLQYAVKIGLINYNPADRVERPRKQKYIASFYNEQELETLFAAVKGKPIELAVILGAFYGLRRSEAVGLRWDAIDYERKTLTIKHTVTQMNVDGKQTIVDKERTKTKSSYRTLPLVAPFEKLLHELKAEQEEHRKVCGSAYCTEFLDYIYVNEIGERIKPNFITQNFPLTLEKAGLRRIRYHDLRHPYVKPTTKIFSLRLMDFQAQAYPDARQKTRGACQLHQGEQNRSSVRPFCNRKRFSCSPPQSKMSRILYAISMRLSGYTSTRSISSSASSVVSVSASKIALDASLRLSCRACSSCFCFACANTAA